MKRNLRKNIFLFSAIFFFLMSSCHQQPKETRQPKQRPFIENISIGDIAATSADLYKALTAEDGWVIPDIKETSIELIISPQSGVTFSVTMNDNEITVSDGQALLTLKKGRNYVSILAESASGDYEEYRITVDFNPIIPSGKAPLRVNTVGFFGGSGVSGATVSVYAAGAERINANVKAILTTDNAGHAEAVLDEGLYDLVATGRTRAESVVENIKVTGESEANKVIILRKRAGGTKPKAPVITKLQYQYRNKYTNPPLRIIKDNFQNGDTITNRSGNGIYMELECPSGCIGQKGDDGNYGIAVCFGTAQSSESSNAMLSCQFDEPPKRNASGNWVCKCFINLINIGFLENGSTEDLIIQAYDTNGNRLERHIEVNIESMLSTLTTSTDNIFQDFTVSMQKYSRPLYTFSIQRNAVPMGILPHNKFETTYQAILDFKLPKDKKISRVEIYRRDYAENLAPDAQWKLADKKVFAYANYSYEGNGKFSVTDDSNTIEEGKKYQYRIRVFDEIAPEQTSAAYYDSPIATAEVLPAFFVVQTVPEKYAVITHKNLAATSFKFKLSSPELFSVNKSDFFHFGFMIVDKAGVGSKNYDGLVYGVVMRYYFNRTGDKMLEIRNKSGRFVSLDYIKLAASAATKTALQGKSVNDLIKWNARTGELEITSDFLNISEFNFDGGEGSLSEALSPGHSYFWDVQDYGLSISVQDDMPCYFVRHYPALDAATGKPLSSFGTSESITLSNIDGTANAITGRYPFSVE